jgi:arylformamidase
MRRFDVSMPLYVGMPSFPGDPDFQSHPTHSIARGDPYNLSGLTFGSHVGTHVDPPRHFLPDGPTIDEVDLEALNGPCEVVEVPNSAKEIGPDHVRPLPVGATRVLFRTGNSARWARRLEFFPDYVALGAAAADALIDRAVRLVGIDSLSIESDPAETYPVHHALLGHGVLILEGLLLSDVPPGRYHLECLPLRLKGGDGGPARATLSGRP